MTTHITRIKAWKDAAETLWTERVFEAVAAARLVADIARDAEDEALGQVARQALPSLRVAAAAGVDVFRRSVARRRFGAVRERLHALAQPTFGRRASSGKLPPARPAAPLDEPRRLLGLPLEGGVGAGQIRAAYKRTAKRVHPDGGGDARAFHELVKARDSLLKGV